MPTAHNFAGPVSGSDTAPDPGPANNMSVPAGMGVPSPVGEHSSVGGARVSGTDTLFDLDAAARGAYEAA